MLQTPPMLLNKNQENKARKSYCFITKEETTNFVTTGGNMTIHKQVKNEENNFIQATIQIKSQHIQVYATTIWMNHSL